MMDDRDILHCIRSICQRDLAQCYDYPFFYMSYREDETADEGLLRIFKQTSAIEGGDFAAVLVMCRG